MAVLETDYLVVGAGAAGMAFTDALIADSDADVVLVERRHSPGGHWNDAYPFVRLHQPSAYYGVNSRVLGSDSIDEAGPNAGLYERATAAEICGYFQDVLAEDLLASGQVRFFGMSEYIGDRGSGEHRFVSRLTGEESTIRVRRTVVDATYLETPVPATHTPSFTVDPGVRFVPVNGLVTLTEPATGFTIIGSGKTAMDACTWLLDRGVAPDAIRWIRPRDGWFLDRRFTQPLDLVTNLIEGRARMFEAAAAAESVADLFRRLEESEQLVRLDRTVEPTMYRSATLSSGEVEQLSSIERVVRQGRVLAIGTDRVTMEDGSIPSDPGEVYVDCSAAGLRLTAAKPVFEPGRITIQQVRASQPTFNAAFIGFVEAARDDDEAKNRLCPPNPYPNVTLDWIPNVCVEQRALVRWLAEPDVADWLDRARLNAARDLSRHLGEPAMQDALDRLMRFSKPGVDNLERLVA
jgi:hypothetical protein